MQMSRPGGVLEANKLAGQAKDKFSKVQELYKVLMKIRLCWTNVQACIIVFGAWDAKFFAWQKIA